MTTWAALVRIADNSVVGTMFDADTMPFLADPDRPGARLINGTPEVGWENATFKLLAATPADRPSGKIVTASTLAVVDGAVVETVTLEDAPVVKRQVAKDIIISRLTDAQLDAALAAMTTRQKQQWSAPGYPTVNYDDPATIALLTAIGADPNVVLAE